MAAAGARGDVRFDVLSDTRAVLGESPAWCDRESCVWWVDIDGRALMRTRFPGGKTDLWPTPEIPGFVVMTESGPPAVGMESGIFLFDPRTAGFERTVPREIQGQRFNDATVDPDGVLWAGTMSIPEPAPVGVLYRIGADGAAEPELDGFITPNGLAVDSRRRRLYVSDSHPSVQTVWTCDLDPAGRPGGRTRFVSMDGMTGRPDGAALDLDGNYWIAGVGGGVIHVFSPDQDHLREIDTPFAAPTKIAFGGPDTAFAFLTSKGGRPPDGALAVAALAGTGWSGAAAVRWRFGEASR